MVDPPFNGMYYPRIDRGSWDLAEHYELLRRGLTWAAAPAYAAAAAAEASADQEHA
jgi:hypothetical protein